MRRIAIVLLMSLACSCVVSAQQIIIDSLDRNGTITYSGITTGEHAAIEWASSLTESNRTNWIALTTVLVTAPTMTNNIPMFFRVRDAVELGLTNGLIANYPFSGNANDTSGNGHTGYVSGVVFSTDRFGYSSGAAAFDGISSKIAISNSADLMFYTNAFTIAMWINLSTSSSEQVFIDKSYLGTGGGWTFFVNPNTNTLSWVQQSGSSQIFAGNVPTSSWHHIALTRLGSTNSLYIDGVFTDSKTFASASYHLTNPITLGCQGGGYKYFKGQLDDVKIFNRSLSSNEVYSLPHATETSGAIVTNTFSPATASVTAGYYASTNLTQVDTDLNAGNVRSGINIFGVIGTFSSNATSTNTFSASTVDIAAGYYAATNLTQVETDLVANNIRSGTILFGITGTLATNTVTVTNVAAVAKTGQTISYAVGDDGNLQKGVAWPNPRFTDNSNGTVKDNLTGLVWLKNANAFDILSWSNALAACNTLAANGTTLTDGSVAGDWRLPNSREFQSLMDYGRLNPALCNTSGTGVWSEGNPFSMTNVVLGYYWTSTTSPYVSNYGMYLRIDDGSVTSDTKGSKWFVWPVRGPQ